MTDELGFICPALGAECEELEKLRAQANMAEGLNESVGALLEQNSELVEALRPFASDLLHLERGQDLPDNANISLWLHVPDAAPPRDVGLGYLDLGDFRKARAVVLYLEEMCHCQES